MEQDRYVFVTVGTTSFDELVKHILSEEFACAAQEYGCSSILMQIGRGADPATLRVPDLQIEQSASSGAPAWKATRTVGGGRAVKYTCYRFKATIAADLRHASVVVSHAGAGSVFEALRARLPLVVAVNTALADNHQVELAEALAERGNLVYGEPCAVASLLAGLKGRTLVPLPPLQLGPFVDALRDAVRS